MEKMQKEMGLELLSVCLCCVTLDTVEADLVIDILAVKNTHTVLLLDHFYIRLINLSVSYDGPLH